MIRYVDITPFDYNGSDGTRTRILDALPVLGRVVEVQFGIRQVVAVIRGTYNAFVADAIRDGECFHERAAAS